MPLSYSWKHTNLIRKKKEQTPSNLSKKKVCFKAKKQQQTTMAEVFDALIHKGYGRTLPTKQRLTPAQLACRNFVEQNHQIILFSKLRERYLRDITICCGGFQGSDQDEPLTISHFSQQQFFTAFDELIYFVDKFDFLIQCLANGICNVAEGFESRFREVTLRVMICANQVELVLDSREYGERRKKQQKRAKQRNIVSSDSTSENDENSANSDNDEKYNTSSSRIISADEEEEEEELDLNAAPEGPTSSPREQHKKKILRDENGFIIKKQKIQILDPVPERHTKQERRQWSAAEFKTRLQKEEHELLLLQQQDLKSSSSPLLLTVAEQGLIEADEQKESALQFAQHRFFEKKIVQY